MQKVKIIIDLPCEEEIDNLESDYDIEVLILVNMSDDVLKLLNLPITLKYVIICGNEDHSLLIRDIKIPFGCEVMYTTYNSRFINSNTFKYSFNEKQIISILKQYKKTEFHSINYNYNFQDSVKYVKNLKMFEIICTL